MHVLIQLFQIQLLVHKIVVSQAVAIIASNVVPEELVIILIVLVVNLYQLVRMTVILQDTQQIQLFHLRKVQHNGHIQKRQLQV